MKLNVHIKTPWSQNVDITFVEQDMAKFGLTQTNRKVYLEPVIDQAAGLLTGLKIRSPRADDDPKMIRTVTPSPKYAFGVARIAASALGLYTESNPFGVVELTGPAWVDGMSEYSVPPEDRRLTWVGREKAAARATRIRLTTQSNGMEGIVMPKAKAKPPKAKPVLAGTPAALQGAEAAASIGGTGDEITNLQSAVRTINDAIASKTATANIRSGKLTLKAQVTLS